MSIIFRVASEQDTAAVKNFLLEVYYPAEPLTLASEPHQPDPDDIEFSLSNIQHGTSVIAIGTDDLTGPAGEIIGVAIAGPKNPSDAQHMLDSAKQCPTPKWAEMLKLLASLEIQSDVYKRFNVTKAVHIHALAVSPKSRGKSIGTGLMQKCMEIAKELGFALVCVDCTSIYSIRIAEKLGMECVGTIALADYRDEQGRQFFTPPAPHNHIKTFVKRV